MTCIHGAFGYLQYLSMPFILNNENLNEHVILKSGNPGLKHQQKAPPHSAQQVYTDCTRIRTGYASLLKTLGQIMKISSKIF
jgi:hypothetical protein